MKENEVLKVVKETKILGKKIVMYSTINNPLFLASDVANWVGVKNVSQMLKQAKIDEDQKGIFLKYTLGGNQKALFITEDALYDTLMSSRKEESKELKKEIKRYLKQIRLTGGYVENNREEEFVDNYLSSLSDDTKKIIITELENKNKELQRFYDDLLNTQGLMDMNTVAKEIGIGEYKLFTYLRSKKILFYNPDNVNIPYERFRKDGKFQVKKVLCRDGKYRDTTLATNEGLEYIRKQMRKDNLLEVSA